MRYTISDEQRVFAMAPENPPVLEVPLGSEVTFYCRDCFVLQDPDDPNTIYQTEESAHDVHR